MTTIYERKLHAMKLDEGLMNLVLSEVSAPDPASSSGREGIGLKFLHFLEHEPEVAREAAAAARLPQAGRKVAAHKLALEFMGWGYASGEMPPAVEQEARPRPARRDRPEYRVIFGCTHERASHALSPRKGKVPREKGGEQNDEVPDQ